MSQKTIRLGHKSRPIKNINAAHLDDLVRAFVMDRLQAAHRVDLRPLAPASRDHWIRETLASVSLAPDHLKVEIAAEKVQANIEEQRAARAEGSNRVPAPARRARASRSRASVDVIPTCPFTPEIEDHGTRCVLTLRLQIKRLDRRRVLIAPDGSELCTARTLAGQPIPNTAIVNAIGLAFVWHRELVTEGITIDALANKYRFSDTRVRDLLNLTQLRPAILKATLTGNLPKRTSLRNLVVAGIDLDWSRQEQ